MQNWEHKNVLQSLKKKKKLSAGTQLPCIPSLVEIRSWDMNLGREEIKVETLQEKA